MKLHVLLPRTALTVVGAARDLNKAKAATEQARKEAATHGETFELVELDLANLKSIRACADGLRAKGELFDEMRFTSLAALSADFAHSGTGVGSDNPVRVALADEQGFPHAGHIDFVDNQLNPSTGTIRARVALPNPDHTLTPGLFARVQLQSAAPRQALLIDDKAVLTDQDRKYVYVVGPGNTAQRKDIVLDSMTDGLRIVKSGLTPEDHVIVGGFQLIFFPGAPVAPKTTEMEASNQGFTTIAAGGKEIRGPRQ